MRLVLPALILLCNASCVAPAQISKAVAASASAPLVVGETFTIPSKVLGEERRINVYRPPPAYGDTITPASLPVMYMPDGGIAEDFMHVAGLIEVLVENGSMRPFLLVGIENTERRRDMTGPTDNPEDRKIAAHVGGSAAFRKFVRTELMPIVNARYHTTGETAVVGESLAGEFVTETLLLEPDLFDTYIAFDPSLWWNDQKLVAVAADSLRARPTLKKTYYFAISSDERVPGGAARFADILAKNAPPGLRWHFEPMPEEKHATIYHPAALRAFRALFAPSPKK